MDNNNNQTQPTQKPATAQPAAGAPRKQGMGFGEMFSKFKMRNILIVLGVITAVILFCQIYFGLMAWTIDSMSLRMTLICLGLIWIIPFLFAFSAKRREGKTRKQAFKKVHWAYYISVAFTSAVVLVSICLAIFTSPMFMAKQYNTTIAVTEKSSTTNEETGETDKYGAFKEDVDDFYAGDMKVAIIDKAYAANLGEKVLGEGDGLASQYTIRDYTLIHYDNEALGKDSLYWVGALEPKGFFQWTSSSSTGTPGYVMVDATQTQENAKAELVTSHPLKYTPGAYFHQDAERQFYFHDMGVLRDDVLNFELDDAGVPYYVQATYSKKFGATSVSEVNGIMTLNAETGEVKSYALDQVPEWVDRVQPVHILNEQLNYWGEYKHGYFNTWFAKKEVNNTTAGYNYVYNNGELYMTTGITAKASDEALVGMVLANTKTKETFMYNMSGATEQAAMKSAENIPEAKAAEYHATFPALINFGGVPTYYMGLKGSDGNIKMYAFVSVEDYTSIYVADKDPEKAKAKYADALKLEDKKPVVPPVDPSTVTDKTITIQSIDSFVMDGNTWFGVKDDQNVLYKVCVKADPDLILLDKMKSGNNGKVVLKIDAKGNVLGVSLAK